MRPVPLIVHPDREELGAAELYVDVLVDGRPVRMLLDTGASSSRIPANDFTRAFARAGDEGSGGRGALGEAAGAEVRVVAPSLEVGGVRAESLAVELAEPRPDYLAAILGLDVLRYHRLNLSMSDAEIALDAETPVEGKHPLVQSSGGHPHVDVEFEHGGTARAIWDTGAAVTVVDQAFVLTHPYLFESHGTSNGIDSMGNSLEVPMVTMAASVIGSRTFTPSLAAVVDIAGIQRLGEPEFAMIVGYPLICQADWAMDLARGWWGFLR
ncbi:aspartyl protease family protein [Nocardioides sp. zg-1228]|uniref:aspartyl protease family protein n=1 Tax=Nocardioides sp. zg-1228 TaxID=2763008 RepID=UPI0016431AEF|nr:aspartyl protease family protein [Nocardioides sp. zg-1228]MBC2934452.1 aspartyl protease family protein [Nocardioides sp. zg-1228]QSF59218.1 aspartyl protease family protein [Nocardioides sp. zg-1228]